MLVRLRKGEFFSAVISSDFTKYATSAFLRRHKVPTKRRSLLEAGTGIPEMLEALQKKALQDLRSDNGKSRDELGEMLFQASLERAANASSVFLYACTRSISGPCGIELQNLSVEYHSMERNSTLA